MKTKIRSRIGTRDESIKHRDVTMPIKDHDDVMLPDGNPDAIRVMFNRDSGEPLCQKDGSLQYCAPWLLSGIFA